MAGYAPPQREKTKAGGTSRGCGYARPVHPTTAVVGGEQLFPWNIQESKTIGRDFAQRRPPPALRHLPHTNRLGQAYIMVTGRWRTDDGWGEVVYHTFIIFYSRGLVTPVLDLWRSHRIGL